MRGGAGVHSYVACHSHLTIDRSSLSKWGTVPTPNRDTSNIWALIACFPHIWHGFFLLICYDDICYGITSPLKRRYEL